VPGSARFSIITQRVQKSIMHLLKDLTSNIAASCSAQGRCEVMRWKELQCRYYNGTGSVYSTFFAAAPRLGWSDLTSAEVDALGDVVTVLRSLMAPSLVCGWPQIPHRA
jgi:hypothetical protein